MAYWERKYPGYTLNRVETRVSNAGWRHTTVIMRRAECWHGTPGCKVMRSETVKHIVKYYGGIPEAIKLLKRERDALEDEYNGLGGLAMDGMPHSSAPGNPTEALAVRVIENGVKNRLQEIGVQVEVLEGDAGDCPAYRGRN